MAFTGSSMFKDRDEIFHEFEGYGGVPEYQSFRDVSFSSVSCFSHTLPQVMAALSDVTWRPHLNESELDDCRQIISYELEDQHTKPHPEPLLMDLVHQAAYSNNTLGLPSLCPSDNISKITIEEVKRFVASHYVPSRMALVGVNVSHDPLVTLAEEHFVNPSTAWSDVDTSPVDGSISQYTGGLVQVERDSAPIIGPNRLPELTHVAIAMESSSYRHDDFYVFAVLNSLMGGGGSFSAGGPGKGMYTRLYLDVLNKHHWIYHAQALNHAYSDSGIFCLFGSCHPSQTRDLVSVLCHQFYQMTKPVHQTALSRAKKQLQSTLLMNLESRSISLEDIGRQVLAHNKRVSAAELCDKIGRPC
jgi:processing peptidase subunit alpha